MKLMGLKEGLCGRPGRPASRPAARSKANEVHGVKRGQGLQGLKKKHCLQGLEACKFPRPGQVEDLEGLLSQGSFPRPGRSFSPSLEGFLAPQGLEACKFPRPGQVEDLEPCKVLSPDLEDLFPQAWKAFLPQQGLEACKFPRPGQVEDLEGLLSQGSFPRSFSPSLEGFLAPDLEGLEITPNNPKR